MSETKLSDQRSESGNASPTSTQRVAKWRARKKRGVLYVAGLEVYARDLRVLKRFGHLASDDPRTIRKHEFEDALGRLLDALALAHRFGVFGAGSGTPAKSSV
jgi:hypothetical protein